nr:2TM domain-containing protein [Candidatus Sigynarchaeota archaeon]
MAEAEKKSPFSEAELKHIAKEKVLQKLGFKIHFLAFIGVNLALLVINYLTGLATVWFVYPLAGWFIGIAAHCAYYNVYSHGVTGGQRIGLIMDATVYAASVPALLAINYFSGFGYWWFLWPACFWLLGVIIQAVVYKKSVPKSDASGEKKSWLDRSVENELAKAKRNQGGS